MFGPVAVGHSVQLTSESGSVSVGCGEAPSARLSDPSSSLSPDGQQAALVSPHSWGEAFRVAKRKVRETHLRISCHDSVVAVIVGSRALNVQGAGPVALSKLPVMDVFPQDLLPVLEPVNLSRDVEG